VAGASKRQSNAGTGAVFGGLGIRQRCGAVKRGQALLEMAYRPKTTPLGKIDPFRGRFITLDVDLIQATATMLMILSLTNDKMRLQCPRRSKLGNALLIAPMPLQPATEKCQPKAPPEAARMRSLLSSISRKCSH